MGLSSHSDCYKGRFQLSKSINIYMPRYKRIRIGVGFILFPLLMSGFIIHVTDSGVVEYFSGLSYILLIPLVFIQSGIGFLFLKKLPILIINKNNFYYNERFMPSNYRDGILFFIFPYIYRDLTRSICYKAVGQVMLRQTWYQSKTIEFKLKEKSSLLSYDLFLNLADFSKDEVVEIYELLKENIKNSN